MFCRVDQSFDFFMIVNAENIFCLLYDTEWQEFVESHFRNCLEFHLNHKPKFV